MESTPTDIHWMKIAISQAELAGERGEVPVGAVIVQNDIELSRAGNSPISLHDPTAHAEILAIRKAASRANNYRLTGAILYVTLEPCIMCIGAIIQARINRVVFGATDPKTGALVSCYHIGRDGKLNHTIEICGGILQENCSAILKEFFREKRKALQEK